MPHLLLFAAELLPQRRGQPLEAIQLAPDELQALPDIRARLQTGSSSRMKSQLLRSPRGETQRSRSPGLSAASARAGRRVRRRAVDSLMILAPGSHRHTSAPRHFACRAPTSMGSCRIRTGPISLNTPLASSSRSNSCKCFIDHQSVIRM
jgi:hypothetical protein